MLPPISVHAVHAGRRAAPFVKGTDVDRRAHVGGRWRRDLAWYNYFTPETSRGSAFAHLTFDLTDHASAVPAGTLWHEAIRQYLSPPSGGQFQTWSPTIYWNNAYLPANVAAKMTGKSELPRSGVPAIWITAPTRRSSSRTS